MVGTAEPPSSGKGLRACLHCKLVKTTGQFRQNGCENCPQLSMAGDSDRVTECTTPVFQGLVAMLEPRSSWVARWQRQTHRVRGVYAVQVSGNMGDVGAEYEDE
jgi:transcription elongation factor SPT4